MAKTEQVLVVIKTIGCNASYILSVLTLITLIIKPLRQWVGKKIIKFTHKDEIDELKENYKDVKDSLVTISATLEKMQEQITGNEVDRLKGELFSCGNRCRRGIPLTLEDFRHIQNNVYRKYRVVLHQNHDGEEEYNYIRDYFNSELNQSLIRK